MGAVKANNKDTYKATAVTLIVMGVLYLIDKLIHFSTLGIPWVMNKDNLLLYTAVIFLFIKRDKSVGLVLLGLWLLLILLISTYSCLFVGGIIAVVVKTKKSKKSKPIPKKEISH